jgi:hypothetical protein
MPAFKKLLASSKIKLFFFLVLSLAGYSVVQVFEEKTSVSISAEEKETKKTQNQTLLYHQTRPDDRYSNHSSEVFIQNETGTLQHDQTRTRTENPNSNHSTTLLVQKEITPHSAQANATTTHRSRTISLVVELRGELGNQLSSLAGARITQWLAAQRGISIRIVAQHQAKGKWVKGRDDIQTCFPNLRDLDFEGGTWNEEFREQERVQNTWLTTDQQESNLTDVHRESQLDFLKTLLDQQERGESKIPTESSASHYSTPFLKARMFFWFQIVRNEAWYHVIREWLRFDEAACCSDLPLDNEIVFHHRNFLAELKRNTWKKGFFEISPTNAATKLFANASKGDKIAIVSRFPRETQPYVDALEARGIHSRLIFNHSGVQDFCFLIKATNELVGTHKSTFLWWGSLLGNSSLARHYSIDPDPKQSQNPSSDTSWSIQVGGRTFMFETYAQTDHTS